MAILGNVKDHDATAIIAAVAIEDLAKFMFWYIFEIFI